MSIVNILCVILVSMNTDPSKTMIMTLLVISMATISVSAESLTSIPSPHKQIVSGTASQDVICNLGLTLIAKLSSGSSACVKPSTALKLEGIGWGQILKESSMMDEQREKMIEEITMEQEQEKMINQSEIKEEPINEEKIISEEQEMVEVIQDEPSQEIDLDYNPIIKPENFVSKIDNKFLTFTPGTTFVYEAQTEDGLERIEVTVTDEKRMVMGVETTVVWDRVWLEGELIEDTKDWYAQDKEGNVWYFGEESIEYTAGEFLGTPGSWEAGIDGAKPGIVMKASPKIGDFYRQEYYVGEAEDTGEVLSLRETVSVPHDRMYYCLKIKDLNPLEPDVVEFKYYCPVIGGVALEEDLEDKEVVELIDVGSDELMTDFPLEEAKKIALEVVPGKVTDVEREGFRGRIVYAIEIMSENGIETDVFIDIKFGKVLGTET